MGEVEWGPVSAWAAATATVIATVVSLFVAFRMPDRVRSPRIHLTFEPHQPWCRGDEQQGDRWRYWVRVGVENSGGEAARGCVGRIISLTTDGALRPDVDPLQLRWAGVPRSRSFAPIDIRHDQREYLNVLVLHGRSSWRIVTFEDPDFDPGFDTELSPDQEHVLQVAVFSDNAVTQTLSIAANFRTEDRSIALRLSR